MECLDCAHCVPAHVYQPEATTLNGKGTSSRQPLEYRDEFTLPEFKHQLKVAVVVVVTVAAAERV